jgi:hypothetical protein
LGKVFANFDRFQLISSIRDRETKYQFVYWLYVLIKPVLLTEEIELIYQRGAKKWELYFLQQGSVEFYFTRVAINDSEKAKSMSLAPKPKVGWYAASKSSAKMSR